jgi:hypothetical protein
MNYNKYIILLPFLLTFIFSRTVYTQNIVINEFMASNSSTITDPDYNLYADWIELFNPDSVEINLKDYFITDDPDNPGKYKIPFDFLIPPGGFVLLWADGMDTGSHTNFSLSASGEFIGLYDPMGEPVDTFSFASQLTDISEGRYPDGGTEWNRFFPASPGTANLQINIYNKLSEPVFSISGGFFQGPVELTLINNEPGAAIRYTIDGSTPDSNSILYSGPFTVDTTTAITAMAFKENYVSSEPAVNTYFVGFETELPVFSLVTDPVNFFSDTSGIYVTGTNGITGRCSSIPRNWNQDWERPVSLEFYETDKSPAFNVKTGVKIYGGCSRLYAMKSLAFYFRSNYGFSRLDYRLLPDIPVTSFNNIVLRSSGQDWWRTMFRGEMVQTLIKHGMKVRYQESRPSLLFLNGQYWGIHNITEKVNDHFLNSHYGVDINNIDLIEIRSKANNGDLIAYNEMMTFLSTKNMALESNYNHIKSIVDIDDYIDYQIAQIYSANGDWPGSNMKLWRERSPSGKWRWLVFDLDFTFGGNAEGQYYTNTLEQATATNGPSWPNPPWSTLMLRKLLDNAEFRNEFIQRFAVHMNTTFNPAYVNRVIDSLGALIASEIPRHKSRWPQSISMGPDWIANVNIMKNFAYLRQPEVRSHFQAKFNLSGSFALTISRNFPAWGKVFAHNVELKNNDSVYTFFNDIPLRVKVLPMPGYRFVRWEGISNSTFAEIEIVASSDSYLKAIFEPAELTVTTLVINEINYKSSPSFDTEDWIELYNPVEDNIDLSGWIIRDNNNSNRFTFPSGSFIPGNGYIVVSRDTLKFNSLHTNIPGVYGNINFGLSSDGDVIYLFDAENNLIDSVRYETSGEWPSLPNGNGPTLSLINPQLDNSLASSWSASSGYGTPGRLNDTYSKAEDEKNIVNDFSLFNNYPNPFNPVTRIRYSVSSAGLDNSRHITLKVFDPLGREVATLVDETKAAGIYETEFNAVSLPSGVYFYQLKAGSFLETKKMVLMR